MGSFGAHFASAAPLSSMPVPSVTVPAGGKAALEVQGFALQPGAALPQGALSLAQQPLASDRMRTALYYGVSWGYAQTDPQQVALALWFIQNGVWLSENRSIAERIANSANAPGVPSWTADGRSIFTLASQGQLSVSDLSLTPGTLSTSSGKGVLVLQNTGTQSIVANLPYGAVFTGASGPVIVWSVGQAEVPSGSQNNPTMAPAPPVNNTGTSVPALGSTSPIEPSATPATYSKGGSTQDATQAPVAEATATQAPENRPSEAQPTQASQAAATAVPESDPPTTVNGDAKDGKKAVDPKPNTSTQKPGNVTAPAQPQGTEPSTSPAQTGGAEAPASNPATNSQSAPPPILNTATATATPVGGTTSPPGPVATSQADTTDPALQPVATAPAVLPGADITVTPTPTEAKKEDVPGATPTSAEPPKVVPTEPNPTPIQTTVPVAPPGPFPGPTIVTGTLPGDPATNPPAGSSTTGNSEIQTLPNGQTQGGSPESLATTGGGQSLVPLWLTVLSAMMVLGGWTLRRMSNVRPQPVVVRAEVVTDFYE